MSYASEAELARILKIANPSAEQTTALTRVLLAATGEIDLEIGLAEDDDALTGWQLALATEVCLERAVEHWKQQQIAFGIVGLGDGTQLYAARDSWDRHALKLAPLKTVWGLA